MLGSVGRVVPGPEALRDSTNAAQRQKRSVPKGWGGIGGIAALRRRGELPRAVHRRRALHYPQWNSHIPHRIYELEYRVSLTLIFNIPVFRSLSKEESARILVYTANQLKRVGKGIYPNAKWKPKSRKGRQLRILQNLPGIGRERAQLLLEGFGSVENCITADLKALMRVEGIGPKTAEGIRSLVSESKALYGSQDTEWEI